ncbi:MAG TPA: hypothetical protein VNF71_11245 [Acidimicrobiales bacterium]|nr:hypothetical protein [Acidimicrobiales bacterium]
MIAIVAVLGVATLALLVAWGLRVIHDIEDLEDLSARAVGPAREIRHEWLSAGDEPPVTAARNVRLHPADSSVITKAS